MKELTLGTVRMAGAFQDLQCESCMTVFVLMVI
jgi:hypothetical protein